MIMRQNCHHPNGSINQEKAKRVRSKVKLMMACFFSFFYDRGIVHYRYAPQDVQLTKNITKRFFVTFKNLCDKNDPTCGQQRTDNSTMTTHLLIPPTLFKHFSPSKTHHLFLKLPTLQTWLCVTFSFFQSSKQRSKGRKSPKLKTLSKFKQYGSTTK